MSYRSDQMAEQYLARQKKLFVPPKMKPLWATYRVTRSPKFKVHASEALARAALSFNKGGVLYRTENHAWVVDEFRKGSDSRGAARGSICAGCDEYQFLAHDEYLCEGCRASG